MHKINVPCSVHYEVWEKFTCGFFLHQKRSRKRCCKVYDTFCCTIIYILSDGWWYSPLSGFMQDFEFFLCIFLHHLVLSLEIPGSLPIWRRRRRLRTKNHAEQESPGFYQRNLRRWSEMRTSSKTKWYKNMHNKNSKSCINPESGEYHHTSLRM